MRQSSLDKAASFTKYVLILTYIFTRPRVLCPLTSTSPAVFERPPPLQRQGAPQAKGPLGRLRLANLDAARGS